MSKDNYDEAGGEAGWVIDGLRKRISDLEAEKKDLVETVTYLGLQNSELVSAIAKHKKAMEEHDSAFFDIELWAFADSLSVQDSPSSN